MCFNTASLAHCDAVWGERHPPHLYNEIPKNASSAIKAILLSIEKEGRINQHYARWFTHHKRWQAAYPDITVDWDEFEWRGTFRFAFQRNPFDRVVSAYRNAGWADHYGHMEFPAFVEQLPDLLQAPLTDLVAIHLKPFACFVPKTGGVHALDFIGKVENFDVGYPDCSPCGEYHECLEAAGRERLGPQAIPGILRCAEPRGRRAALRGRSRARGVCVLRPRP